MRKLQPKNHQSEVPIRIKRHNRRNKQQKQKNKSVCQKTKCMKPPRKNNRSKKDKENQIKYWRVMGSQTRNNLQTIKAWKERDNYGRSFEEKNIAQTSVIRSLTYEFSNPGNSKISSQNNPKQKNTKTQ